VFGGLIISLIHGYKVLEPADTKNTEISLTGKCRQLEKANFDIGSFKPIIDGGKAW
jgi:hypothetical protein